MASSNRGNDLPSAFPMVKRTHGRLNPVQNNPQVEAILRKLVPDQGFAGSRFYRTDNGRIDIPDPTHLRNIGNELAQNTTDATSLSQILPDMGMAEELLCALIMSPKDLNSTEITFKSDPRTFHLPMSSRMLEVITDHFTNVYDLKKIATHVLHNSLFRTGSTPYMVTPENSVDELINGQASYSNESVISLTRETLFDPQGEYIPLRFLGNGYTPPKTDAAKSTARVSALESFISHDKGSTINPHPGTLPTNWQPFVKVTDNYNVAKLAMVREAGRASRVARILGQNKMSRATLEALTASMEGFDANYDLGTLQRRNQGQAAMHVVRSVKTKEMVNRPTVGHPLVQEMPSEAVIPIFLRPDKHLGYFILLDQEGHPLRLANRKDIYNDLTSHNSALGSSNQDTSQMIQMAKNLTLGININQGDMNQAQMVRLYGQLLEHDLKQRMVNGGYDDSVRFQAPDDIYAIMLARTYKRQQTQILYVPADLMTYFAFDYAENGTGRSLTEKSKVIASMRAMLTFANTMAGIKNSVSRQAVNVEFSENNPDPVKTMARMMDEFTRKRNTVMPWAASDASDMISYINLAGVEWNFSSAGKGIPQDKVSVEDKVSNRAKVDKELSDDLRDRHYLSFYLTPETVLASAGPDFATTAIIGNQMLSKRVMNLQDEFTPQLEDLVKKISHNSAIILNKLREVVLTSMQQERMRKEGEQENTHDDVVDQTANDELLMDGSQGAIPDQGNQPPAAPAPQPQTESVPILPDPNAPPAQPKYKLTEEDIDAVEKIVRDFIESIMVSLPRPDSATMEAQKTAYTNQKDAYTEVLEIFFGDLTEADLGGLAQNLEQVKKATLNAMMRQWCHSNNYVPELAQLTSMAEDGTPELDLGQIVADHNSALIKSIKGYLELTKPVAIRGQEIDQAIQTEFPNAPGAAGGMGGMGGDMNNDFNSEPGGDLGGGGGGLGSPGGQDDLGGDLGGGLDDLGLGEPPAADDTGETTGEGTDVTAGENIAGGSETEQQDETEEERRKREEEEDEEDENK